MSWQLVDFYAELIPVESVDHGGIAYLVVGKVRKTRPTKVEKGRGWVHLELEVDADALFRDKQTSHWLGVSMPTLSARWPEGDG